MSNSKDTKDVKDNIYVRTIYVNGEGKEVVSLQPITEGTTLFAAVLPLMTPMGYREMDFIIEGVSNITDAFGKFDETKDKIENEVKKHQNKPKLTVPGQNNNLKLVTS